MRIGSSNIGMESSRNFSSLNAQRASVMVRTGTAGLRMNPKAEDGTENSSITGQDAYVHIPCGSPIYPSITA